MNRILELRETAGLNQAELAEKIGVSQSTLASWELGETEPDVDNMVKLSNCFDVAIDYLLGRTNRTCLFCGGMYDTREDISCPHCLVESRG
ncbi:MAG: helix-turn-helix transcriptional regulator [Oscillospiraceae bacterium]|nr:helix-turn-helix transcriptional regulator [Oscillospiraceae bacterium]